MKRRTFGRTGLQVSEVVFGGGWVGGLLIHQDDDTKLRTLRRAMEAGINLIDTAPSYGKGESEKALGWLLKEIYAKPFLSTKVMVDAGNPDDLAGQIERSLHDSLERLNRSSVDLLQLHNPIGSGANALRVDQVTGANGAARALERLRDQGLTRFIGMTALGKREDCRRVIDSGRFDSAQVYYNLLNPSAGRGMPPGWRGHDFGNLIAACSAQRMAVMAMRVFAAGVLASDERHGREVIITEAADLATEQKRAQAVYAALGARHGTRAQTALRFALSNPDISCAVIGLAEPGHLDEAMAGAERGALPPEALEALEQVYAKNFDL